MYTARRLCAERERANTRRTGQQPRLTSLHSVQFDGMLLRFRSSIVLAEQQRRQKAGRSKSTASRAPAASPPACTCVRAVVPPAAAAPFGRCRCVARETAVPTVWPRRLLRAGSASCVSLRRSPPSHWLRQVPCALHISVLVAPAGAPKPLGFRDPLVAVFFGFCFEVAACSRNLLAAVAVP